LFQSTRPCGARRRSGSRLRHLLVVSIHAPVWGATSKLGCYLCARCRVSIHAPVWGATLFSPAAAKVEEVSIHAPVWGATDAAKELDALQKFQSTRPCGARHGSKTVFTSGNRVSIHAPVWGATKGQDGA